MSNIPHQFESGEAAATACADYILSLLHTAIAERGIATLAVSGGTTPKLMFEHMRTVAFPWDNLRFYFVDERAVLPENKDSNYRLANESFLAPVHFPRRNIFRIEGELDPDAAAAEYAEAIRESFGLATGELPVFDVIQHGMGPDGHTASLFPGEPLIDDRTGIAASVISPDKAPRERITLLPGVLLASRASVFLLDGESKAPALQEVLTGEINPKKYPSQLVARSGKNVDWFIGGLTGIKWPD
jgi:6-phosphogluconolactonase